MDKRNGIGFTVADSLFDFVAIYSILEYTVYPSGLDKFGAKWMVFFLYPNFIR